jgi:hypothetical protein
MQCVDGGSNPAATQTQSMRGPDGTLAVLQVSSADDHSKNAHLCNAEYRLLLTPPGNAPPRNVDLLSSDGDWNRDLSLRLDGFAHDGNHVFGVLIEQGKFPTTTGIDYDIADGKVKLFDLKKRFARITPARCAITLDVAGTTVSGGIVLKLTPQNHCAVNRNWLLQSDGKVQKLPPDTWFIPLLAANGVP